ncbi:hypothetical protein ACVWZ6_008114 [Bradyrhizobium sp. GM6.1]
MYPLYSFYAKGNRDKTCIDVFNSGFEYGRPLPTKLSDARAHYWTNLICVPLWRMARFSRRANPKTAGWAIIKHIWPKSIAGCPRRPFDLVESQLHLLCRDLFEAVDENRHLPLLVRRNGLTIYRLDSEGRPSSKGCVRAIENLRGWLSDLDPDLRRQFRSAVSFGLQY